MELPTLSKRALETEGFAVIERREPSLLADGCVLITGEVDRTTEFERGMPPAHQEWTGSAWQHDPLVLDDQALVVHVRGQGLVVLTGCGHAGAVNIVRHAQRLTGIPCTLSSAACTSAAPRSGPSSSPPSEHSPGWLPGSSWPGTARAGAPSMPSPQPCPAPGRRAAAARHSASPRPEPGRASGDHGQLPPGLSRRPAAAARTPPAQVAPPEGQVGVPRTVQVLGMRAAPV